MTNQQSDVLVEIPEEKYFVLADGTKISHYADLAHILEHLHEDIVKHHISDAKHDFAAWIKDVFSEYELANELAQEKDPEKIQLIIYKHLVKKYLRP